MQQGQQPFWARLQLFARLTLNARNNAANKPAPVAQLDHGNDRAILIQGDEGSAQSLPRRRPGSFGWGIAALHRLHQRRSCHPRRPPHSVYRFLDSSADVVKTAVRSPHDGLTVSRPGTRSLNPSPSSGESTANLTFGG